MDQKKEIIKAAVNPKEIGKSVKSNSTWYWIMALAFFSGLFLGVTFHEAVCQGMINDCNDYYKEKYGIKETQSLFDPDSDISLPESVQQSNQENQLLHIENTKE